MNSFHFISKVFVTVISDLSNASMGLITERKTSLSVHLNHMNFRVFLKALEILKAQALISQERLELVRKQKF